MLALELIRFLSNQLHPFILKYLVPTHDSKEEPVSVEERLVIAKKIEGHITDFTVYASSSVWGLMICMDQEWMPWYLGGQGDFAKGFVDIPYLRVDQSVLYYGMFQFGVRLKYMVEHLCSNERGNDYEEMLLHDTVTCFLYFGYLFSNFLPVGTMVVILHDISDILCHVSKAANVSKYSFLAPFPFIGC